MAFLVHTTDDGRVPGIEYLPAKGLTPQVGMALTVNGGNLAVASGAELPKYISMTQRETACAEGELIPVTRVLPDMIFESDLSEATDANIGDKLSIAADGMSVAATAGGAVEVVYLDGNAVGDMIRLRFTPFTNQAASVSEIDTTEGDE